MQSKQFLLYIVLSFLFLYNPVLTCKTDVDHCKHPDQMVLLANRTILSNAPIPETVFTPPPGYNLTIDTDELHYCDYGGIQCFGNITYTFLSICPNSDSFPPIQLASVTINCESIGVGLSEPIPPSAVQLLYLNESPAGLPDLGIVIFVSSEARTGGASLAQRDADCQHDASLHFAGVYKALLAVNDSVGPLVRFSPFSDTAPVVRPDGAIVVTPETSLIIEPYGDFAPLINAPNEHADGSIYTGFVYTGLTVNPTVLDAGGLQTDPTHRCKGDFLTGKTCSGYSCSLHECTVQSGTYGDPDSLLSYQYVNYTLCDTPLPVYCLRNIVPFQCPT